MASNEWILCADSLFGPPPRRSGAAVLVRGGRIAALGPAKDLAREAPGAERLELGKATLLPGFLDSHTHFFEWARRLAGIDLSGAPDHDALRACLARHRDRRGSAEDWLGGSGWDPEFLQAEPRLDRSLLDEFFPDRAVALESRDFHTLWCNTRALERAGVFEGVAVPAGGEIGRREDGSPDGLLYETAWQLILDARPPESERTRSAWLQTAISQAHTLGLTGFHSMEPMGAYHSSRQLADREELQMRVVYHSPLLHLEERLTLDAPSYRPDDPWLRWGGVKIFMDGSLGSRSAYMLDPYPGGDHGRLFMSGEELVAQILRAAHGDIAPTIHAIGDACVRVVVDALEEAQRQLLASASRLPLGARVEHAQCVRPEEIPRLARLGVLCAMQPIHLADDLPILPRLWPRAAEYACPTRSLLRAGVEIALGSDAPVASPDPRLGIYAAISRRAGNQPEGASWHPEEALSPEEALYGYTTWAARAGRWDDELGSIEPGRRADLVAVELPEDGSPEEAWRELPLRMTMVDGHVVHEDLP